MLNGKKKCLLKFNGMFAFGIWDLDKESLFVARDRYGIKPVYYGVNSKTFAFASEQKALEKIRGFERKIDAAALYEYLTFQNILSDRTLNENIKILPAGNYLNFSYQQGLQISQYWDFDFSEPQIRKSNRDYEHEFQYLFEHAVESQLVSDVDVGAYLSGGIDSGSIATLAARSLPNLKTFTCGFDLSNVSGIELGFDERSRAEAISSSIQSEQYEVILKSGDMERCLPRLIHHLEEPRVGQSYPNYFVSNLASKFVKVVLSGIGGDEIFGGYPWRYYASDEAENAEQYIENYYKYWKRLLPNKVLKDLIAPIKTEVSGMQTLDIFKNILANRDLSDTSPSGKINNSLYFEAKTFLHGLLVVEDKISMSNSLETRVPFLDNNLVDFAMSCPVELKLNKHLRPPRINENEPAGKKERYFLATNDGKQIVRRAMEKYVSSEVLQAQKRGFSAPDSSWFKGRSIDFVKHKLGDQGLNLFNYVDFETTQKVLSQHFTGKENRRLFIWSMLHLSEYFEAE